MVLPYIVAVCLAPRVYTTCLYGSLVSSAFGFGPDDPRSISNLCVDLGFLPHRIWIAK